MLKQIYLENFRNHQELALSFSQPIAIITGINGIGKTSLLEAIFALATLKPFRSAKRRVFIKSKGDYALIKGDFSEESLMIYWQQKPQRKTVFKRNEIRLDLNEYLTKKDFLAILYAPEDNNLPFTSPRERRKFLARTLVPIRPGYFQKILDYEKVLRQRNKLLQLYNESRARLQEFDYWDQQLISLGEVITRERANYLDFIAKKITSYFQLITGTKDTLSLYFKSSSSDLVQDLANNFRRDLALGSTSVGAHRDDFELFLNKRALGEVGSRGEVRSAILAFKKAEFDFIFEQTSKKPLLLFDDVFSELDSTHRQGFLQLVAKSQTIITATDFPRDELKGLAAEELGLGGN
jgi:DNA replication and repair protein RecF